MAIEKKIILEADVKDAVKNLEKVKDGVEDIGKTSKKTEKDVGKISKGLKGVGLAFKAIGIGIVLALFNKLSEALMKNEVIADTVSTIFNSIGIVFKLVSDTLVNVYNSVSKSSENFDALGKVAKNVLVIAITPLKLAFQLIKLGIQGAMLAWEKSFLGGKDADKIAKLTASINDTKQSIKDTAITALNSGKAIVENFGEAVGELVNIGETIVGEFKKTFEGVTVASIIEQGKAITQTKKNYALLALQQQRLVEQYDREAEIQRQLRDDIRLTVDERIAANEELGRVLEKQAKAEKRAVQAQIDAVTLLEKLEGSTNETIQRRFELNTELIAIQAKVTGFQSEQQVNEAALQDEKLSNMQELTEIGKTELEKQFNAIKIDAENRKILAERTITDQEELQAMLIAIDKDAAAQKKAIEDELLLKQQEARLAAEEAQRLADEKALADAQALADAKVALMNQQIDVAQDIFGSLSQIAVMQVDEQQNALNEQLEAGLISQEDYDKQSEALTKKREQKERRAALIQILIDTAQSIAGAVKAGAGVPFPGNIIAILTGVGAALAGIVSAKAVLSDAGGDTPDTPDSADQAIAPGGMGALTPNVEAIEAPELGGGAIPVQAYVVENDISNSQALQDELELQSTL